MGGPPRLLIAEASGAGFSPDGKWVAYTKHLPTGPVLRISAVEQLDRHVEVQPGGFVPRWSPDSHWIAYTTADPNATEGALWMASVSLSSGGGLLVSDHTRLTSGRQAMYGLSWTADGRSIIFAGRRPGGAMHLYRVWTSGGAVAALTSGAGDYACPSVAPDGKRVIFWHGTPVKNLMLVDGLGSPTVQAITDDEYHLWPALSPSGTHIASVVRRPTYQEHLYLTEIATRKRIALSARPARHPAWMDDKTVAYLEVTGSGRTDVRLVNIAVGPKPLTLTELPGRGTWFAVHPDRTTVALVLVDDDRRQRIVLRQIGGREPDRTLAQGGEYEHLRWRPDGSALSWSGSERSSDPASNGIWLVGRDRSAPRRIVADGYGPVWSDDGTVVYFSRIREYAGLWKYDLRQGREAEVRQWAEEQYEFDVVGDRLVYTASAGRGRIFAMSLDR
jgi:Tol biopolymer transport system component